MKTWSNVTTDFVGRIAVAVWLGKLSDDAAREALRAFAAACQRAEPAAGDAVHDALLAEYRHRRDGQDLCS